MTSDLVLCPGGYRPAEHVHHITRDRSHADMLSHRADMRVPVPAEKISPIIPAFNGYQATALGDCRAINQYATETLSLITNFDVPYYPSAGSQTIFIWPGIFADIGGALIQPVLQWGPSAAGNANGWAVANWYIDASGRAFHDTLVPVGYTQTLSAFAARTGTPGDAVVGFANVSAVTYHNVPQLHVAAFVLETYNVNACNQFPALLGGVPINFRTNNGGGIIVQNIGYPVLNYFTFNQYNSCGWHFSQSGTANPGAVFTLGT